MPLLLASSLTGFEPTVSRILALMYSRRFSRQVIVTQHASRRMAERNIDDALLLDLIDNGNVRHKDEVRLWIAKHYPERTDNLLCAAVLLETVIVVKTVMHHFVWEP